MTTALLVKQSIWLGFLTVQMFRLSPSRWRAGCHADRRWLRILQQDPKAAGESHWAWLGLLTAQSPSDTLLPTKPYLLISSIGHSTVTNIQIDGSHSYSKNLTVHPSHAGLELAVSLQLQPPMFWVYSCAPLCPTRNGIPPCITWHSRLCK